MMQTQSAAKPALVTIELSSPTLSPAIMSMFWTLLGVYAVSLSIADRGYVVQNGAVVLEDTAKHLLTNETVRAAYLGL